jgi:hypothetical protein
MSRLIRLETLKDCKEHVSRKYPNPDSYRFTRIDNNLVTWADSHDLNYILASAYRNSNKWYFGFHSSSSSSS